MEVKTINISVGAEIPFSVLHMTDNHISIADKRDDTRKNELAKNRADRFTHGNPEKQFELSDEMLGYIKSEGLPLIHTGDFLDFVSYAGLDYAEKYFDGIDTVMCAGNHEYSLYVGEAAENEEYRQKSRDKINKAFPCGIEFGIRRINGIKFITMFDGYYYILPEHIDMLKNELSENEPVVLVLHNPVYSADTYKKVMHGKEKSEPPYLIGCPDELLKNLSADRRIQQSADSVTAEFVKICNTDKRIKAIISGHLHGEYISVLDSGTIQVAADAAYHGIMYKYNFI